MMHTQLLAIHGVMKIFVYIWYLYHMKYFKYFNYI